VIYGAQQSLVGGGGTAQTRFEGGDLFRGIMNRMKDWWGEFF